MVSPEVVSKAAAAPRMGHGLGFTMWKECAWWVIESVRCFLGGIGLIREQIHRLGLWRLLLLKWLEGGGWMLLIGILLV